METNESKQQRIEKWHAELDEQIKQEYGKSLFCTTAEGRVTLGYAMSDTVLRDELRTAVRELNGWRNNIGKPPEPTTAIREEYPKLVKYSEGHAIIQVAL